MEARHSRFKAYLTKTSKINTFIIIAATLTLYAVHLFLFFDKTWLASVLLLLFAIVLLLIGALQIFMGCKRSGRTVILESTFAILVYLIWLGFRIFEQTAYIESTLKFLMYFVSFIIIFYKFFLVLAFVWVSPIVYLWFKPKLVAKSLITRLFYIPSSFILITFTSAYGVNIVENLPVTHHPMGVALVVWGGLILCLIPMAPAAIVHSLSSSQLNRKIDTEYLDQVRI